MSNIIYVGSDPFGGRSLSTPTWVPGLIARWEDAPGAQTVYVSHAERTTGWDTPGGPIEGFDLRTLDTDDTQDYWVRTGIDAPYRPVPRDGPRHYGPRAFVALQRCHARPGHR